MEHKHEKTKKVTKIPVLFSKRCILKPEKSTLIEFQNQRDENLENVPRIVVPNESLEKPTQTSFTSPLSTIKSEKKLYNSLLNFADDQATLPNKTEIGRFHLLTSDQTKNLFAIDPCLISLARMKNSENTVTELNQLIQNKFGKP